MNKTLLSALACACVSVNATPILDVQFSQENEVVRLRVDGIDLEPGVIQTSLSLDGSLYETKTENLQPYKIAGNIASLGSQFETGPHTIWFDYVTDAGSSRLIGEYTVSAYIPPVPDSMGGLPLAAAVTGLMVWRRRSSQGSAI